MKKLILVIALSGFSAITYAQDFGKTLISGSISYNSSESESGRTSESTTFNISPKVGWFINPRIALGAQVGYSSSESVNTFDRFDSESKFNSFSAGPFARIYQPIADQFAFFAEGSLLYSQGKSTSGPNSMNNYYTSKSKGGIVNLSPGLVFFPTNQIGLEITFGRLGYNFSKSEYEGANATTEYSDFVAGIGLSNTSIGISIYLGRGASE